MGEMSRQHEGFRFWENLEKKSGSQDSISRSFQSISRDGPKTLEHRISPQGAENRGTGMKPGELARLEAVVSRLELEGGTGRGDSSRAIQVEAEEELLKRLALATTRIERSVGLAR